MKTKLDSIFDEMCLGTDNREELVYLGDFHETVKLKQQIKDLFNELIGEYETEYSNLDGDAGYWEKHGRNEWRKELLKKVQEL